MDETSSYFNPIFSKISKYIMSLENPPLIIILEMLKLEIVDVMTKGNVLLRIPQLSRYPYIRG